MHYADNPAVPMKAHLSKTLMKLIHMLALEYPDGISIDRFKKEFRER